MNLKYPAIVALFALAGACVLLFYGLPPGHSARFNYAWTVQYADAMSWTNPLPRYLPDLWNGLGGQDFFFYAPLPFWISGALVQPACPTCNPVTVLSLTAGLFLVGSGLASYAFLRQLFDHAASAFGAVVFVFLPYHFVLDWFARQAAGEFAAYAFLPLAALGVERLRQNRSGGWIVTLGVAGVCLSHLPTALLAAHVIGLVAIVLTICCLSGSSRRVKFLAATAGYAVLGLGLASFYWLPAIVLFDSVSTDLLYNYHSQAWRWLIGPGNQAPNAAFADQIKLALLAAGTAVVLALSRVSGTRLVWIAVPSVTVLFLNLWISEPIWRGWIISRVQFPWRLLTFLDLATAVAFSGLFAHAVATRSRNIFAAALLILMIPLSWAAFSFLERETIADAKAKYTDWMGAAEYLSPEMIGVIETVLDERDNDEWLNQLSIISVVTELTAELQAAQPEVHLDRHGPREISVDAPQDVREFTVPIQYWSLWQAEMSDGQPLTLTASPDFGTLHILAPEGGFAPGVITLRLPVHWSERTGYLIAALSAVALAFLMLQKRRRQHLHDLSVN